MTRTTSGHTSQRSSDDERLNEQLNEQFHTLLRKAAEKREGRARVQSTEDAVAARQESADLLALGRGQAAEKARGQAAGPARGQAAEKARGQARGHANRTTERGPTPRSDSPG